MAEHLRPAGEAGYIRHGDGGGAAADHGALTGLGDDDHTQYRLESEDHTHQSTGLQGGQLDHGAALTGLTDDDHTIYLKEKASGGLAAEVPDHTHTDGGGGGGISGRVPDPTTTGYIKDEFASQSTANADAGELGWGISTGSAGFINSEANHPGIMQRNTVGANQAFTFLPASGTLLFLPALTFDSIFIVRTNQTDADTNCRLGFVDSSTPANGIYFEKLNADTNWFVVTRAASTQTRTDTGVAVAASFKRFRIRRVDANTIGFSIDGGTEVTHTANIPTVTLAYWIEIGSASGAKTLDIDFFDLAWSVTR